MRRTLLVTNDFPPRIGGIQSYLRDLCALLPPDRIVVLASSFPGDLDYDRTLPYPVVRMPTETLLPTPGVLAKINGLIDEYGISSVWFGAAAPLAMLAKPLRAQHPHLKLVASTHGHEVGWSMLPGARQILGRIGRYCDTVTYVSRYARNRFASAFGAHVALEPLPGAVDTDVFAPQPIAQPITAEPSDSKPPTVICVSRLVARKGQDILIQAWPQVCAAIADARLLIVGQGPDESRLQSLVAASGVVEQIDFAGRVPDGQLPQLLSDADLFAMPVRTRGWGLDVEGLGIVYLEAQACGTPAIVGNAGGAPETVRDGVTGCVVDGTDVDSVAATLIELLSDPERLDAMSHAARQWALEKWTWSARASALRRILGLELGPNND